MITNKRVLLNLTLKTVTTYLRAIFVPGLLILGLVLFQYPNWLVRSLELGMREQLASTIYTKIPASFFFFSISLLLLLCLPIFIGQLELLNHYIATGKSLDNLQKNKRELSKYNSHKRLIRFRGPKTFEHLFFGLYIPKVKRDFNIWYRRYFNLQSIFLFGLGTFFVIISQMRPQLVWANFAREYLFTLLMINLLIMTANSIFNQLKSPLKRGMTN